ncbi:MAG: trypsin-like peptidase domain-containing protein [Elusimicrobia bacterium]|nr:trypsin-like peptidase domain-containing protein [Elusimicrobiota bacterium]
MALFRLVAAFFGVGVLLPVPAWSAGRGVSAAHYGRDDRIDLHQTARPLWLRLADSTVALFQDADVAPDPDAGQARLKTAPFKSLPSISPWRDLCKGERFYGQPAGAVCSGFLVAPDVVATAGHCVVSDEHCRSLRFVFGFAIRKAGVMPDRVAAGDVYGCAELLGREAVFRGSDWALVRLDRLVVGRLPLEVNAAGSIAEGTPVLTIGHPSGLPAKIAAGGRVRDASAKDYFVTNLDGYHGGSGSPVFHAVTGRVEGILVNGDTDYEWRDEDSCWTAHRCPENGCRGEDVTRMSVPASRLSAIGGPGRPLPSVVKPGRGMMTLMESVAEESVFP